MNARARLGAGEALLGLLVTCPGELVLTTAVQQGYDFLFLDREHGEFTESDLRHAIDLARTAGTLVITRIPGHDPAEVRVTAESGVDVVLVPHVSSVGEAEDLAAAMAAARGTTSGPSPLLMVVLESAGGVANAAGIMAVAGVDGAFVGPNDLSIDLGAPHEFDTPAYEAAIGAIEDAVRATGKILGTVPHPGHPLDVLRARGHRLLVLDVDASLIGEAMRARLAEGRSAPAPS